ncbi:hypothetical protein ACRAWG_08330 [Methylobacterium sp. P31]
MVEHRRVDPEILLGEHPAGPGIRRRHRALRELRLRAELRPTHEAPVGELLDPDAEIRRMGPEQVPGVGVQAVGDPGDEPFRPDEAQGLRAVQADPQQTVEPGEVVHVGVRHEDVAHPHQLPGGERGDVTEIEQQGPPRVSEVEIEAGIREGVVDEAALDEVAHARQRPDRRGRSGRAGRTSSAARSPDS